MGIDIDERPQNEARALELMRSPLWRLNNLYSITDKMGKNIPFKLNAQQLQAARAIHEGGARRVVVLKARQLGFSTLFDIMALDAVLWSRNRQASICADTFDNAKKLLQGKVHYAYDRLPDVFRHGAMQVRRSENALALSNGGAVYASTRVRSGTNQFLHVSELGKISHKDPLRAKEVLTGAFPTVPEDGVIVVESTFEGGKGGVFYDLLRLAMEDASSGWTFLFFPWYDEPSYALDGGSVPEWAEAYFRELERLTERQFSRGQRAWYARQRALLGEAVKKEYPSTPEEAFEVPVEGAIYGDIISRLRTRGRIVDYEWDRSLPVHAFWDIGWSDSTAIWFVQFAGCEIHFIDFYENSGEPSAHYARQVLARPYGAPMCYLPHDADAKEKGSGLTYRQQLAQAGLTRTVVIPRTPDKWVGINGLRNALERAWFNRSACARGIECLEAYHKKRNDKLSIWEEEPVHDWASNAADAARYVAEAMAAGLIRDDASPDAMRAKVHGMQRQALRWG